jgi:hypothetical protein
MMKIIKLPNGGELREYPDGTKEWHNLNGKLHREDGHAMEFPNGDKWWYRENKLHRENGPAIEYIDGSKFWYVNDKRHRIDGPAIEYGNGKKWWFLNGMQIHCETQKQFEQLMRLKAFW